MKRKLFQALALAGMALAVTLVITPAAATAEVRRIELDVTGYLCGM